MLSELDSIASLGLAAGLLLIALFLWVETQRLPTAARRRLRMLAGLLIVSALASASMSTAAILRLAPGMLSFLAILFVIGTAAVLHRAWKARSSAVITQDQPAAVDLDRFRLLDAALRASHDGIVLTAIEPGSRELRIIYTNPAFEAMTGYGSSEAIGMSPSMLYDDRPESDLEQIREALHAGVATRVELPARHKDGSLIWAEWCVVPVAGSNSEPTYTVAILRDTTDRRRAEEEIRQIRDVLSAFLTNVPAVVSLTDAQGRFRLVNPAWERTTGIASARAIGRTGAELHLPPAVALGSRNALCESGILQRELGVECEDGRRHYLAVRFSLANNPTDRKLVGSIGIDVTEQVRTEKLLREQEEVLQTVMANIPCGVYWTDRNAYIVGCNEQASLELGIGTAVTRESTAEELSASPDRDRDSRVLAKGAPLLNVEENRTWANGRTAVVLASRVPLRNSAGEITGLLGLYLDITERKRLEEKLHQTSKLEAIGRLAGGIAHDFNNLLTIISGNAALILANPDDPKPLAEEVRLASDRGSWLVRQILTFSRPQPIALEVVDLVRVVGNAASILGRLLGPAVDLNLQLHSTPVPVLADRTQLDQVIINLAVNARDAMPNGGSLSIHVDVNDGQARLVVADTGCGMTEAVKNLIFEPFFTTKGPDKGTGLGLATVHGIVRRIGGSIDVDSELGNGTSFRILLPLATMPVPSSPTPADPFASVDSISATSYSVLVVEDEPGIRRLAQQILHGRGFAVTTAEHGAAALAILETGQTFDLVVTDLRMPGIGGEEVASCIRTTRPNTGILFISGNAEVSTVVEGSKYLSKPFSPTELVRAVHELLAFAPAREPAISLADN